MKLLSLILGLLAAALPLRAQNIFAVTENGASLPVRAMDGQHPLVADHGKLRHTTGTAFALRRAAIFSPGLIDIGAFKIDFTTAYSQADRPDLHISGRLKSDIPLKHCFYVLTVTGDLGKGVFFDELPDLPAGEYAVYDRLFPLDARGWGTVHFQINLFADGLQVLTSKDDPMFVARQHEKTRQVLARQQAPH